MEVRSINLTDVYITDHGCVTSLGRNDSELWAKLLNGQCGFAPVTRFSTANYVNNTAACIKELDAIPHGQRASALIDMVFDSNPDIPKDCALITASTKGNIEWLEGHLRESNNSCDNDPPAIMPGPAVSSKLGLNDNGFNVNAACASSTMAVLMAAEMIKSGQKDAVLIFGLDLVTEFVYAGFSALKAMSETTARPFDANRDGLILGEAGAYMLLMSKERAKREGRNIHGQVAGCGSSSDATHITAPARDGCGLKRAVTLAVDNAGCELNEITAINAHGTGTIYNDAMELTAFNALYNEHIPPIFSVKGAIGHCLGPCGLVEMIIALRSLKEQVIPPIVGMSQPDEALANSISGQTLKLSGNVMLKTNSGFGGTNVALILKGGNR